MEMYCVYNQESKEFLNYASKRKHWLKNRYSHYVVESPFPTLRPKNHIKKCFEKWIKNTPFPEDYKIVKFALSEEGE